MDQTDHANLYRIDRRRFLVSVGIGALGAAAANAPLCVYGVNSKGGSKPVPAGWTAPPAEFSLCPFWFWNDALTEQEIVRQIEDFQAHGVHGFLIHPRAGLPRSIGWMSKAMLDFMRLAIEEAAKRRMWVVLYDEGMYPSGSSSGQVVAENPAFRTRGLFAIDLDEAEPGTEQGGIRISANREPVPAECHSLVAIVKRRQNGHRIAVIDRPMRDGFSTIRGLHFLEDDPPRRPDHREVRENAPPGADILNPQAVECFIRLVYQRYYDEFKDHFGKTVAAIFTDEPSMLAKGAERGAMPGTTGILEHVNQYLGYDFTDHLASLWYKDEPDADRYRAEYSRALAARLEQTFYAQIHRWCASHGVALTGHPAAPDDIGHLRHFDIPGQDIVWRYIEPGKPSALEGAQSTQGKCASSAMIHLGRRRNLNEYCGAFGHNFTFDEMKWLTRWLIVRGCNMLVPHAFYYSIRGPRIDERPPDVGPNSPWWGQFKPFAEAAGRLCWLNTDSKHACSLAILGLNDYLPWEAAKVCLQNQRDFNYLEAGHLWEDARVEADGIHIGGMHYQALIMEFGEHAVPRRPGPARAAVPSAAKDLLPAKAKEALGVLERAGRLIRWDKADGDTPLLAKIGKAVPAEVEVSPATPDVRLRHVVKEGTDYYILFNEGQEHIELKLKTSVEGQRFLLDPETGSQSDIDPDAAIKMQPHELKVIAIAVSQ